MADIQSQIRQTYARNKELLATLRETDHAPPDLQGQERYIADLSKQLAAAEKKLLELGWTRKQEFKQHESYRDSVVKRFAFKVSGRREKFDARAEQEEREYFDALQKEHRESKSCDELRSLLADARAVRDQLEASRDRHAAARQELDSLYDSIFQGPTPGFPDEDAKERAAAATLQAYHEARVAAETEMHVLRELEQAQRHMQQANRDAEEARSMSHWDMWGGGTMADMMERESLHKAETQVQHARMNMSRAQQMSQSVRGLPDVEIAHSSIISDVLFDNIFTDMAFHDRIKDSIRDVQQCLAALDRELVAGRERYQGLQADLEIKERRMEEARAELQKARESAFESLNAGKTGAATTGIY